MNSFCEYCTANNKKEIKHCKDTNCPFYSFRFANLDHDDEREIAKKLLREVGILKK